MDDDRPPEPHERSAAVPAEAHLSFVPICQAAHGQAHYAGMQAASVAKKERKDEQVDDDRPPEPQERSAAVLARGRIGHAVRDWFSPRLMVAGGGLFMSLSRWGLLPPVSSRPKLSKHAGQLELDLCSATWLLDWGSVFSSDLQPL